MMSKLLVLVAAVLCLATAVSAQTAPTQIVYSVFDTATCGTSVFNTTRNAGECQSANGQYTTAYCSTDGGNVYIFTFTDASCNSSYVSSVTQIPTTCGWLAAKAKYSCVNPTAGPASPMAFPPAGWAQSSSCVNATNNYAAATTCSANGDANIHCTQSATLTGVCRKTTFGNVLSQSTGCTSSGQSAVISYSDDKCGTMISATVVTPGCYGGVSTSSCGSNTVASLPNKGYTSYDNDACAASTTKAPVTTLFTDSCYNSLKFDCSTVNGTTSGTFTTYADATGKGLCPANAVQSTLVQPVGVCQKGLVFTCAFNPAPTGAASATGASMVAMIVAAIVALVASLSL